MLDDKNAEASALSGQDSGKFAPAKPTSVAPVETYVRRNTKLSTENEELKKQIADLQATQVASPAPGPPQRLTAPVENARRVNEFQSSIL